jgi:hypothetical protein
LTATTLFALLSIAFATGYLTHRGEWIPFSWRDQIVRWEKQILDKPNRQGNNTPSLAAWSPARAGTPAPTDPEFTEGLNALGYLGGVDPVPEFQNVTIFDQTRAYIGLNLYVAGNAPEAILMDMDGRELHRWRHDFWETWPDFDQTDVFTAKSYDHFRRAYLYPNGDLLAIHSGIGIVRLNRESKVIWAKRGGYHHDLQILDDGEIYILDAEEKTEAGVLEDYVAVLDADGNLSRRVSLLACFVNSPYRGLLDKMPYRGDIFHTNTLEVLDGTHAHRSPLFRSGNLLISVFKLNTIAIIDLEREQVVWALTGMWVRQHQPSLLENGNMMLFDNQGHGGRTKVIEFDPFSQEVVWAYADRPGAPLFSALSGSAQRLPNGNTLITESNPGRALEVTPGLDIVWEFYCPYRAGEQDEFIANLLEVVRLPHDAAPWLSDVPPARTEATAAPTGPN